MRLRALFVVLVCLGLSTGAIVQTPASGAGGRVMLDLSADEPDPPRDACGVLRPKADGGFWDCTFVDHFEGTELDPTRWLASETRLSGVTNGSEGCYVKSDKTVKVSGGKLYLTARRRAPFTCQSPLGDFTTTRSAAGVTTRGRFSQAYGRFAFRARMPKTQVPGAHSTMWLYPKTHTYGLWPLSGEVDVAEWYSALPGQVFPSLHYADGGNNIATGQDGLIADMSRYHTYVVEWTPTTMRFYYDGVFTFEHSWTALGPLVGSQPFDQAFNVVMTQAWGGKWNAPTVDTPKAVTMAVAWVKVWK